MLNAEEKVADAAVAAEINIVEKRKFEKGHFLNGSDPGACRFLSKMEGS